MQINKNKRKMSQSPWAKQISNRNYLSPVGFKLSITKIPKVDFFSNSTIIPGINLGVAIQPTYLKDIPVPGDKLTYDDLSLEFFVDENLENYLEVHNWLRGLGYPNSIEEFINLKANDKYFPDTSSKNSFNEYSDATLTVYNSNFNPIVEVHFKDIFPVSLSSIKFDAKSTDINYVVSEVNFKYSIYDINVL
jgi:hypothetical protein